MDLKELPTIYPKLQKQYALPDYTALNNEFELLYITLIASVDFPLRLIRRRISDRFASTVNFLQAILQPNPGSVVLLKESGFFSAEEKKEMQSLLRQFMALERQSYALDLQGNEKEDAEFIKRAYQTWITLKKTHVRFVKKLPEGWNKEEDSKQEKNHNAYMG